MNESDEYVERLNKIKIPIDKRAYKKQKKESVAKRSAGNNNYDYSLLFSHPYSISTDLASLMVDLEDASGSRGPSIAVDFAERIANLGYGSSRKVRNLLVKSYENMIMNPNYQNNITSMGSPKEEKGKILTFLREH